MKNMLNKVKGMLAVMMMACMLLTMGSVSSKTDYNYGIMPCSETIETEINEL